jgi:hypothetical protein
VNLVLGRWKLALDFASERPRQIPIRWKLVLETVGVNLNLGRWKLDVDLARGMALGHCKCSGSAQIDLMGESTGHAAVVRVSAGGRRGLR